MSKRAFKEIVRTKTQSKAFEYLTKLKISHSKAKNIRHMKLELQSYLWAEELGLNIRDNLAARTRMIDVKYNFKAGQTDTKCCKCKQEDETRKHLWRLLDSY